MKESCAEQNKEELRSAGGNIHVHKKLLKAAHSVLPGCGGQEKNYFNTSAQKVPTPSKDN